MVIWENKTVSVGIDLQKTQFSACALSTTKDILFKDVYSTTFEGYNDFIEKCNSMKKKYNANISMAIEATDDSKSLKNLVQYGIFYKLVFYTLKYKKVSLNNKKIEINNSFIIAESLLNDI